MKPYELMRILNLPPSAERDFEIWWYDGGSGIIPIPKEDAEEHTRRVSKIAWLNATYKANYK